MNPPPPRPATAGVAAVLSGVLAGVLTGVLAGVLAGGALLARGEGPAVLSRTPPVRHHPWALAASGGGRTLFVACGGARRVVAIDVARRTVARSADVGGTPRGLAVSPDGSLLAVTLGPEDALLLLDSGTLEVRARVAVPDDPEGVAFDAAGGRAFVACKRSGEVARVDLATGRVTGRLPAGREPFALARSPDGSTLAAVSRRVEIGAPDAVPQSVVTLIDAAPFQVRRRVTLASCHLAEAAAFAADGRTLLVPLSRVRNLLPILQVADGWVMSSALAFVDVASGEVRFSSLHSPAEGFADPAGIAVAPDSSAAWVASGGGNAVGRVDLPGGEVRRRVPVGGNPRGVAWLGLGADGDVAVSDRLDDSVTFLTREGDLVARVRVGRFVPDDARLRGERAFHDAAYCFQRAFSCASCHPEVGSDGLVYDFEIDGVGRNPVLNRSLEGLAGTDPFKWTGLNYTVERQCGARFAMVLTRADPIPPDRILDLRVWLYSVRAPAPVLDLGTADEATRGAVERGRRIFERSRRKDGTPLRPGERCISCHPPPLGTNRQRTDVGTRGPLDSTGRYDAPHLGGVATHPPYLHDGRATTLEAIWTEASERDRHGYVSDLSPEDLRDLVRFLESL